MRTNDAPASIDPQKQKAIESLFDGLPATLPDRYSALEAIRRAFYAELAKQFQPTLNEFARAQPQASHRDWSDLATSVNRMVRHLGMAIVCPRTHAPATLVVDTKRDGGRTTLRYRFHTINRSGRRTPTFTSYELPDFELCQAPTRVEALSKEFKDKHTDSGLGL